MNLYVLIGAVVLFVIVLFVIVARAKSNWLARFLDWNREVIESAETPFAKLAIFILPILSPIVPAFMTGLHVFKLMQANFDLGTWSFNVSMSMAVIVGIVLELIGYVGVVSFIQDLYRWVKDRKSEYLVPALLNGMAYLFYLILMWKINFELGRYFGTPDIMNNIIGWLSYITVPTGLLAANHLNSKTQDEKDKELRHESMDFRLKNKALKQGINIFGGSTDATPKRDPKEKHASDHKERIPVMLQEHYEKTGKVLELTDITAKLKLDHSKNKGFVSTERTKWMAKNGIEKPSKPMGF